MTDAVAIPVVGGAKYVTDEAFTEVAQSTSFIPRLNLFSFESTAVKEGKIQAGRFGYTPAKDTVVDLGDTIRGYALSYRLKALDTNQKPPVECFNPKDPLYRDILNRSGVKDSGCLCGAEFLIYLPECEKYVTFHMASATLRRDATKMLVFVPKPDNPNAFPFTMAAKRIKKDKYMWFGPEITTCTLQLPAPETEACVKNLTMFNNPPEPQIKAVVGSSEPERPR